MKKAVIIGVGPLEGLGARLCQRFAAEGLHVILAGRTGEALESVVERIRHDGGQATSVVADATREEDMLQLFDMAADDLDLAIYNVGNNMPGRITGMEAGYFEKAWRAGCYGGFVFGREALRRMVPRGGGTLLFTGASASLRGRANFGAFNAAKAALRAMAQAMAKEAAADGVHVGHVVIDGAIGGDKIRQAAPEYAEKLGEEGLIELDGIVDGYLFLYRQPPRAWTFELDVRTSKERW
jgi:NAD(P)-dependent dehydrogenase (short-subunit alcohol dehydrogenase family)